VVVAVDVAMVEMIVVTTTALVTNTHNNSSNLGVSSHLYRACPHKRVPLQQRLVVKTLTLNTAATRTT